MQIKALQQPPDQQLGSVDSAKAVSLGAFELGVSLLSREHGQYFLP